VNNYCNLLAVIGLVADRGVTVDCEHIAQ